jgi:hypothetical protein
LQSRRWAERLKLNARRAAARGNCDADSAAFFQLPGVLRFAFFTDFSRRHFREPQDTVRSMRLRGAGIGRSMLRMEMHFGPEKYGLLQSRRRRCEIVVLRSGFASASNGCSFLTAKRAASCAIAAEATGHDLDYIAALVASSA